MQETGEISKGHIVTVYQNGVVIVSKLKNLSGLSILYPYIIIFVPLQTRFCEVLISVFGICKGTLKQMKKITPNGYFHSR